MTRAATNELTKKIQESGMTVSEVAKKMNVSRQTIDLWAARGIPRVRIKKLAKTLGVPENEIPNNYFDISPNVRPRGNSILVSSVEQMRRVEENYKKKCERLNATAQKLHENFLKERDALREKMRTEILEIQGMMNKNTPKPIVIQPQE